MKTEAACGSCPLSLLCLLNKPLVVNKTRDHNYMRKKGIPNIHRIRVCSRCLCVFFEHEHTTFICGMIRHGQHTGTHPGRNAVMDALVKERRGYRESHRVTWTKGCQGGKGRRARLPHPLQEKRPQHIHETDPYDCFDQLADHITEVL